MTVRPFGTTVNQSSASSLASGATPTGTSRAGSSVLASTMPLTLAEQYQAT